MHAEPIATVTHRHALGAVQRAQVIIGDLPQDTVHVTPANGSTVATPRWLISHSWSASIAGRGSAASGQRRDICRTHRFDPYAK
ncbi:hypothetical protein I553_4409 [Mycobacterium xenopi 4042]|uniref:Uncharacterized protein n=1 Tax=Mycobacterium xenopi 4042 TaxID=1299334 RepID=X8AGK5_MYCXE|nr:hypothetical protein I553_4409 [Mycobacterium xenopi 4042]